MKFIRVLKAELATKNNIDKILQRNGFIKNNDGYYEYDGIKIYVNKIRGTDKFDLGITWHGFPNSIREDSKFEKMMSDIHKNMINLETIDTDNLKDIISQVKNYVNKYSNKISNTEYDKESFANVLNQEKKEVEELLEKFNKINVIKMFKDYEFDEYNFENIQHFYNRLSNTLKDINYDLNKLDKYDNEWFENAYKSLKKYNFISFDIKEWKDEIKLLNKLI